MIFFFFKNQYFLTLIVIILRKKSGIREAPTLSTDAHSSNNTIKYLFKTLLGTFAQFVALFWSVLSCVSCAVCYLFNVTFHASYVTALGNLLDFFLIYVWWSLDYFWRKKCRLNKRAKKNHKKLPPPPPPPPNFIIWNMILLCT